MNTEKDKPVSLAERETFRISELKNRYGLPASTAYKLIADGKLDSVVVGRSRFVIAESVRRLFSVKGGDNA